jgi:hypothetical protein
MDQIVRWHSIPKRALRYIRGVTQERSHLNVTFVRNVSPIYPIGTHIRKFTFDR